MRCALVALALVVGAAHADPAAFYGNWQNAGRDDSGVSHVVISPAGGDDVSVRVYGNCHPVECSWGLVEGRSYTADPKSDVVESIVAEVNFGFAHRQIIFRKGGKDRLTFEVLTDFSDGTNKHDFDTMGVLKRTAWAGPLGQSWQQPRALDTGWGGGARSGIAPRPAVRCMSVDPRAVRAVKRGPAWKIAVGKQALGEAGGNREAALRAEDTIRHYRFDRLCRIATMTYWTRARGFPSDRIGGADCIGFNSTTVHIAHIGHTWKIVDGVQWIASFDEHKGADALLGLIRTRHLDAECFVERRNPVMVYWLSY